MLKKMAVAALVLALVAFAVHAVALQSGGNHLDLFVVQVRRNLHKYRYAAALGGSQLFALGSNRAQ